jgi:hypothetical protein
MKSVPAGLICLLAATVFPDPVHAQSAPSTFGRGATTQRNAPGSEELLTPPAGSEWRPAPAVKPQQAPAPQSKPAAAAAGQQHGDVTVKVTMKPIGRVDSSHVRMHNPQLLATIAHGINAGTLAPTSMDYLVGRQTRETLLNADRIQPRNSPPAKPGAPPQQPPGRPGGNPNTTFLTVGVGTYTAACCAVDHSPKSLAFPAVWDGQQSVLTLNVTSPMTGPVSAALPAGTPFRVLRMTAYDGTLHTSPGSTTRAARGVSQSRTAAPWTVNTVAGQDVAIDVAFQPVLNIGSMLAGNYSSTLTVSGAQNGGKGPPWKADVPTQGFFRGKSIGVLMNSPTHELFAVLPTPPYIQTQPEDIDLPITLININDTATGTIRANALPQGVTMDPLSITVPRGQTVNSTLHFHVDRTRGILHGPQDSYPVTVRFDYNGPPSQLGLTITVLPTALEWDSGPQSCLSVDYSVGLTLFPSGSSIFVGTFANENLVFRYKIEVHPVLGGERLATVLYSNLDAQASDGSMNHDVIPGMPERFLELSAKPVSLDVHCWN